MRESKKNAVAHAKKSNHKQVGISPSHIRFIFLSTIQVKTDNITGSCNGNTRVV